MKFKIGDKVRTQYGDGVIILYSEMLKMYTLRMYRCSGAGYCFPGMLLSVYEGNIELILK